MNAKPVLLNEIAPVVELLPLPASNEIADVLLVLVDVLLRDNKVVAAAAVAVSVRGSLSPKPALVNVRLPLTRLVPLPLVKITSTALLAPVDEFSRFRRTAVPLVLSMIVRELLLMVVAPLRLMAPVPVERVVEPV